jgi:hypothetical protein
VRLELGGSSPLSLWAIDSSFEFGHSGYFSIEDVPLAKLHRDAISRYQNEHCRFLRGSCSDRAQDRSTLRIRGSSVPQLRRRKRQVCRCRYSRNRLLGERLPPVNGGIGNEFIRDMSSWDGTCGARRIIEHRCSSSPKSRSGLISWRHGLNCWVWALETACASPAVKAPERDLRVGKLTRLDESAAG